VLSTCARAAGQAHNCVIATWHKAQQCIEAGTMVFHVCVRHAIGRPCDISTPDTNTSGRQLRDLKAALHASQHDPGRDTPEETYVYTMASIASYDTALTCACAGALRSRTRCSTHI
jgi:hypothetical protein